MWVTASRRVWAGCRGLAAACSLAISAFFGVNACAAPTSSEALVVHAGTLLAVPGQTPKRQQTLVIQDGRIAAVRDGWLTAAELGLSGPTSIIDLSSKFVMPGLIDLHVHLTTEVAGGGSLRTVTQDAASLALVAAENARKTLAAGFTTVLDLGTGYQAHEEAIYALRAAVDSGRAQGPRILAVGSPLSATGRSRTGRYSPAVTSALPPQGVCDGPAACAAAVREQIRRGADVICFYTSGSLNDRDLVDQTFTDEEMLAIVSTAHALGRKVVADGHTAAAINAALRAGADIIDTAPWPDDETWRLWRGRRAWFEPHMHAFRVAAVQVAAAGPAVPRPPSSTRIEDVMSRPFSAVAANQHGVPLVYGSDTGIVEHGDNAGDLMELVRIGLTPMAAIAVATVNSAAAIGLEHEIGALQPGMRADLIALDRDPLADITAVREIAIVMRDGRLFDAH